MRRSPLSKEWKTGHPQEGDKPEGGKEALMVQERPVQGEREKSCRLSGGGWKGQGQTCAGFEDVLSLTI